MPTRAARRSKPKRERRRRGQTVINEIVRLHNDGHDEEFIAKAMLCSEELVVAVLRTHPPEERPVDPTV